MQYPTYLTAEEFICTYLDTLPPAVQKVIKELQEKVEELEEQVEQDKRTTELREEQLYFAQEFVQAIDSWVDSSLPRTEQKEYKALRSNTNFEV